MGKNNKADVKGGGRSKSMPFIKCTPIEQTQNVRDDDNLPKIIEEGDENVGKRSRLKSPDRRAKSPNPRAKSPNPKRDQSPRRKYKGSGPGLMGKLTRNSAPALDLPPPEPIVVEFVSKYVNQLKAVPFTLSEKMSRWCKRSPMALYKSHMPPQDHDLPFPTEPYEDLMCDEFGRNTDTLARVALDGPPPPRDELVLQMYPPGRHSILNSFDKAPATPVSSRRSQPKSQSLSKPPPVYVNKQNSRPDINNSTELRAPVVSSEPLDNEEEDEACEMFSPMSPTTRKVNKAGDRPAPVKRVATNISIIPQRTRSNLDDKMIAEMAERMNAAVF